MARTVSLPILSEMPSTEVQESFNKYREESYNGQVEVSVNRKNLIHAEVVTFVAESLEAGGLPGYPEVLVSLK